MGETTSLARSPKGDSTKKRLIASVVAGRIEFITMNTDNPLPPAESWRVIHYQLVTFWEAASPYSGQEWWRSVTGGGDCDVSKKGMHRTDTGQFQGRMLQLSVTPIRADWTVAPILPDDIQELPAEPYSLGSLKETNDWCVGLLSRWLSTECPPVVRLSLVTRLVQFTASREDNYRLLDKYLPDVKVDSSANEFQYRINRKRQSTTGVPSLEINRLTTWSSVKFDMNMLVASTQQVKKVFVQPYHAGLVETDVNTDADREGLLPADRLLEIWTELGKLTEEIAAKGDVP